jgi:signal transduction histidine kinase
MTANSHDSRIALYAQIIERLKRGEYEVDVPLDPHDEIGQLSAALRELAQTLAAHSRELQSLNQITARMNAGLLLDEILEHLYQDFRGILPYNRIGLALIEDDGQIVRSYWDKSDQTVMQLEKGYAAPLAGSSLETIIATGQPRILNDLVAYLERKPESKSTRLILAEGIRSSLTCPLLANGVPVGFIFFSSIQPNTYADVHVEIFKRIAQQLAVIVEKGRLASELVAQKAAIEKQNQELRRLNTLKNAFLGMAAHDLRNPLALIQSSLALLLDPDSHFTEAQREYLHRAMERQAHHMLALLDDLLDVTEIESESLTLKLKAVDLGQFLNESVELHNELARPKGTCVVLETAPPGTVVADPDRLDQLMDNLISNAVKYSPPGSTVRVSAHRLDSGWRVSVKDEGPGITEQDRQRLFHDFARLSARPTGGEKSIGLGLAIARRIVDAHGGQVGVDSEPGHGATFWFTLPGRET